MKTYLDYIKENKEFKIIELSYFDFINLYDVYDIIDHKDNYGNTIEDIIKQVENNSNLSKHSNKYYFLACIKNEKLYGIFYKQLRIDPNLYSDGYIISKGCGKELLKEMNKLGSFTTFSNITNIPSMKAQLTIGAEIIYMCDNPPDKETGQYDKNFSNQNLKQLLLDEKIFYRDNDEDFYFFDEKGKLKIKELKNYLENHNQIEIINKSKEDPSKIKIYFLYK